MELRTIYKDKEKWETGGAGDRLLIKLLRQNEINADTRPKTVYERYPNAFGNFTLATFRRHFTDVKKHLGGK